MALLKKEDNASGLINDLITAHYRQKDLAKLPKEAINELKELISTQKKIDAREKEILNGKY